MKRTPVVLVHGAWFDRSSWENWAERFTAYGYAVCVPDRPGGARTARGPGPLRALGLAALTARYARIVRAFDDPPVLIGHSVGGLVVQHLLGAGLGRAAVALAPLPVGPTRGPGREPPSRAWFRHVVANAVGEEEATELFDRYAVPAPPGLLTHPGGGAAGLVVDTANSARGPLLLVSGQEDRMVPDAVTRALYKLYGDSSAVTDLKQFADRGHSLVFDSGWRPVADHVLAWLAAHGIEGVAARG